MDVLYPYCAGIGVHKKTISVCVLTPGAHGKPQQQIRECGTTTRELLELADWLLQNQVTHVGMESTGVYGKPIWNILEGGLRPHFGQCAAGQECTWQKDRHGRLCLAGAIASPWTLAGELRTPGLAPGTSGSDPSPDQFGTRAGQRGESDSESARRHEPQTRQCRERHLGRIQPGNALEPGRWRNRSRSSGGFGARADAE